MSKIYELYTCSYQGRVVYVGEGIRGRHKHCNSGCSHVYELNKIHFLEGCGALTTDVVEENVSKEIVSEKERLMIDKFEPVFNKNFTKRYKNSLLMGEGKSFRQDLLFYGFDVSKSRKSLNRYENLCKEFVDYFGHNEIKSNSIEILGCEHYLNIGRPRIASLSRWLRESRTAGKINNTPNSIIFQYFKNVLDLDLRDKIKQ